VVENPANWF